VRDRGRAWEQRETGLDLNETSPRKELQNRGINLGKEGILETEE